MIVYIETMIITARNMNAIRRICIRTGMRIIRQEKRTGYWIVTLTQPPFRFTEDMEGDSNGRIRTRTDRA